MKQTWLGLRTKISHEAYHHQGLSQYSEEHILRNHYARNKI